MSSHDYQVYYASVLKPLRGPLPAEIPAMVGRTLVAFSVKGGCRE